MSLRTRCSSCGAVCVWITRPDGQHLVCLNAQCTTGHKAAA